VQAFDAGDGPGRMHVLRMPNFRKLVVWQEANAFAHVVHKAATRIAPRNPRLADQIMRAAEAVPAFIAEGSGLGTDKAFANRVSDAIGEISEVENHAQRGFDDGYFTEGEYVALTEGAISIRRKLIGLRRTLRGQPRRNAPNHHRERPEPKREPKREPKPEPKAKPSPKPEPEP
jgi:four helix bundle protein